ncbi:MAG: hypothetical protein K0S65_2842 [Labilithrix sp.]|nr:hypothetical protein [Labilithrix sp.]
MILAAKEGSPWRPVPVVHPGASVPRSSSLSRSACARFWTGVSVAGGVWLAMLLAGGRGCSPDEALRRSLYAGGEASLVRAAALVTIFGGWAVLTAVTVAVAISLLAVGYRRRATLLLCIVLGGRAIVALMKMVTARERPAMDEQLVVIHSMSFPSGHAANALITYLALALLVPVRRQSRAFAVAAGIALASWLGGAVSRLASIGRAT